MKSQVGLARLHPDGSLDQTQDTLTEQTGETPQDTIGSATTKSSKLVSLVVHVEKDSLDELMQKPSRA